MVMSLFYFLTELTDVNRNEGMTDQKKTEERKTGVIQRIEETV